MKVEEEIRFEKRLPGVGFRKAFESTQAKGKTFALRFAAWLGERDNLRWDILCSMVWVKRWIDWDSGAKGVR